VQKKICFFGHFGSPNFGNEITLETILHHLRRCLPEAKVTCACTGPEALARRQKIATVPINRTFIAAWRPRSRLVRFLRRIFVGLPSEFCRWLDAFKTLKGTDILIIPGTGLLTDAYGLLGWGPYNLFRWSSTAKLCGCELLFVSVGAGPIQSRLGRYFVKSALSLADFRSYRDDVSMACVKGIGLHANGDRVYPDLAFSLPDASIPRYDQKRADRLVVGLGLITYGGMLSAEKLTNAVYLGYLNNLVAFAGWLLTNDYVIRLLIGEADDKSVSKEFKSLLTASGGAYAADRIIDEPARSVDELLPQIGSTDVVVATRFHNLLLALVLDKPVIAISFHHKCASLMSDMGLQEYCHDINNMDAARLIQQFQHVQRNAEKLKTVIKQCVVKSRKALDEQYGLIFNNS
jgi:polysaccharide pyruvyl transferase WcaK-like protein